MSEAWYNIRVEKRKKREHDFSVTAFRVVQEATTQSEPKIEKPVRIFDAKALGRLGGLKGGKVRTIILSPERRSEVARKAARARWSRPNRV